MQGRQREVEGQILRRCCDAGASGQRISGNPPFDDYFHIKLLFFKVLLLILKV
jgi:hypothetical protein